VDDHNTININIGKVMHHQLHSSLVILPVFVHGQMNDCNKDIVVYDEGIDKASIKDRDDALRLADCGQG
jgi:hypothetical protein